MGVAEDHDLSWSLAKKIERISVEPHASYSDMEEQQIKLGRGA